MRGQLADGRPATEDLLQLVSCSAHPQGLFLEGAGHMQPPAAVPEVAFELTHDTGDRERHEPSVVGWVVAVDGADQPGPGGLDEILRSGPAAVPVAAGEAVRQVQIGRIIRSRSTGSRLVA
jgi:hypothetical protein